LKLEREVVSLPELLADTGRQIAKLAQERGVNLSIDNPQGQIWGDPIHLRQVILILLDNALRFTPRGGAIHIDAHPQGKLVQISVTDSGCGIPPEHVPHVFERFYQVSPGNEESHSNGLGLSIAKALVEAQGGKIHLESWLGKGTRVTISLPNAAG
jgi:signal transduction histidine kinase